MSQLELIHESIYDALRDAIRALGGSKAVGAMLWPARSVPEAQSHLADCLNPGRREKLAIDEVLLIMRKAREVGYHGAMHYIAAEYGYGTPQPLDPADERAELQRLFAESVKAQRLIADRLERLLPRESIKAVA